MMLRNMRIGTRLTVGFGLVVAALLVVVVGSTLLAKRSRDELTAVLSAAGAKESLAAEMKAIVLLESSVMRNVGLRSDIRSSQADEDRARKLGKDLDKMIELQKSANREALAEAVATGERHATFTHIFDAIAPPREARGHYRPALAARRLPATRRREPALPAAEGEEWNKF